jgi:hypothetical protein
MIRGPKIYTDMAFGTWIRFFVVRKGKVLTWNIKNKGFRLNSLVLAGHVRSRNPADICGTDRVCPSGNVLAHQEERTRCSGVGGLLVVCKVNGPDEGQFQQRLRVRFKIASVTVWSQSSNLLLFVYISSQQQNISLTAGLCRNAEACTLSWKLYGDCWPF